MLTAPLSSRDIQVAQLMGAIAVGVLVGMRFVPARHRQRIGITLTIAWCGAVAAFAVYWLIR